MNIPDKTDKSKIWKQNKLGFSGMLVSTAGLILYPSMQYYGTILWPAAAGVNPELPHISGALVSGDSLVVAGLPASGIQ